MHNKSINWKVHCTVTQKQHKKGFNTCVKSKGKVKIAKKKQSTRCGVQTSYLPCVERLTSPRWTCSRCLASLSFSSRDIITSFQSCSHQSIVADDCISTDSRFINHTIINTIKQHNRNLTEGCQKGYTHNAAGHPLLQ